MSSLPMPSMSMFGMLDGICRLWGGIVFTGFSTAASAILMRYSDEERGIWGFGLGELLICSHLVE